MKSPWILCSKELPDSGAHCFVQEFDRKHKNGLVMEGKYGHGYYFDDDYWEEWAVTGANKNRIKRWMYIPE